MSQVEDMRKALSATGSTKEKAQKYFWLRAMDRLVKGLESARKSAGRDGLSEADIDEAWRRVLIKEVHEGLPESAASRM